MLGLLEIFYAPGKVFDDVRERGMWLPAFLGVILLTAVASVSMVSMIGLETMMRKQIASSDQGKTLTAQQIEQRVAMAQNPVVKTLSYAAAPIVAALMLLATAGILMALLAGTGSAVRFPQMLGATSYAWFPFSVIGVLMTLAIVGLTANREDLDTGNLLATNVGAFLDKLTTDKHVYSLAKSMDLLSIGQVAMLSYGMAKVGRTSFGKCLAIVGGIWLVIVLGKAGIGI